MTAVHLDCNPGSKPIDSCNASRPSEALPRDPAIRDRPGCRCRRRGAGWRTWTLISLRRLRRCRQRAMPSGPTRPIAGCRSLAWRPCVKPWRDGCRSRPDELRPARGGSHHERRPARPVERAVRDGRSRRRGGGHGSDLSGDHRAYQARWRAPGVRTAGRRERPLAARS